MAVTSGIKTVQATIKGQVYTLTLNETSGKYETTITAPDKSSYNNNAGHYYPVSITATDQAGNSVTIDDTDSTLGNSLKLKVKEKVKPVISKLVPSNGAYLATSAPEITATLTDDDSGISISTLVLKIDGQTINNTNITKKTGIWLSGYPLFFDMGYKNYIVNVDEYNKPLDWGKSSGRLYLTDYILGDILWSIRLKRAIVYSQVYS